MAILKHPKVDALETSLSEQLKRDLSDQELFSFARYDAAAAERSGYSDYSYWKNTLRVFLKNKTAVFFLIVILFQLAFCFLFALFFLFYAG